MKQDSGFSESTVRALVMLLVVVAGLATTGCNTVPVTGRSQFNFMSPGQEMQLGLTAFEETKKQTPISKDAAANDLVQRVGKRIAAVADRDMPDAKWEFVVFESKEANAFCLPGGKVGIYTGILPITKDEAGLATVMGHEIAHAVARHGGERMSQGMAVQGVGTALGIGMSNADPRARAATMLIYGIGAKVGYELPHSRDQESEADRIGLIYMARAGYDPEAAVGFWERFAEHNKKQGDNTPAFLRTHPLSSVRAKQLREWMPEAKAQMPK
jgi:metalloendopeptidase OMA1, mitochondrial